MWQLIDIAYVIPVTIGIAYFIAQYLEANYEGRFMVPSVLIGLLLGTILTIVKVKRALDQMNRKNKTETNKN